MANEVNHSIRPLKLPTGSPREQTENRFLWNDARSTTTADFFTIGYTGKPIEKILETLKAAGVRTLLDIRQNPVSMYRPELSKTNLKQIVEEHGLQYLHMPELGVPRNIRAKAMETGNREVIWDWYDEYVIKPHLTKNLNWFMNSIEHPVALMCVEIDPRDCHRHRLFMALENRGLRGFDL